ncbi:MAG: V-type ATPase subunit [Planctomycetota bacterium]|jgi:V/A-type H+-transporting ATPase subunit C
MDHEQQTAGLDFYTYPPVGADDWRYVYQSAQVRVLEMQMLTKATFHDMANAENLRSAADLLSSTEYAIAQTGKSSTEIENVLSQRRSVVRLLFEELIIDKPLVHLFRTRDDFANLRLAVRRTLTEKPLGTDYSPDGNVPPELYEEVFEQDNYELFPDYMADAVEQAALAYYRKKHIPDIDHAIDAAQAQYNLKQAQLLNSIFLLGLFRIQIDLTNIRTMLRLKFTESEQRNIFLKGGFLELERLHRGTELGYEALAPQFFVTPYYRLVEAGAAYLASDKSFLKLEQQCEEHLTGFLKSTVQITTGHQPIIAYLLLKEKEIRNVRLILTAKKNNLDTKLILDRIS